MTNLDSNARGIPTADHRRKHNFQQLGAGNSNYFPGFSDQPRKYGDCGETLPLAVAASITSQTGPTTEVRSLAAYTSELCNVGSVTEDGKLKVSIRLKEPCKNCKSLMERIPGSATMLAASGTSQNVQWTTEKRGNSNGQLQHVLLGYSRFSYSAAYAADEALIYDMLKIWTIGSVGVFVRPDIRENLATMWHEFIVPYR
jgi:hypothetical protein